MLGTRLYFCERKDFKDFAVFEFIKSNVEPVRREETIAVKMLENTSKLKSVEILGGTKQV